MRARRLAQWCPAPWNPEVVPMRSILVLLAYSPANAMFLGRGGEGWTITLVARGEGLMAVGTRGGEG
jgi:hypothetical protein